jgi:Restriction endonuclease
VNSLTSDIHQDAWNNLEVLFSNILAKIKWDETREAEYEDDEDEDEDDEDEDEDDEGEYEDGIYIDPYVDYGQEEYLHELERCIKLIRNKLSIKDVSNLKGDFDDLVSACEELNLHIEEEFEEIESYLDILNVYEGQLIYVPKHDTIYTPTLILEVHSELIKMIARNPKMVFEISPRKFEEIIAELFFKKGFEVELTKATRDGGRDIVAVYEHMNVKSKYLIECKRYAPTNKVSIGIVQRLFGVKVAESANKAILATTSFFTKDARNFANNHLWDLDLKDYNDIMAWIKTYRC